MEKFNCIVVEDEPIAAEILHDYIKQVPFLNLKGTCRDALYAMELLQKEQIDLMFLDIHLPGLKGIDFIKTLQNPPRIIITTAYHEYALEGYENDVIDYLLKPISYSRFLKAVNKLNQPLPVKSAASKPKTISGSRSSVYFNMNKKKIKVFLDEILYIESLREFIKVVTSNKTIITKMQTNQVEELLAKEDFVRVHRSFIVAKEKIEVITGTDVEINGKLIPIGRNYKEVVQAIADRAE